MLNKVFNQTAGYFVELSLPLLVGRVFGLCAGIRWGPGGLRGDGGGARDVRARTATGDDDNLGTTPFFFAEIK